MRSNKINYYFLLGANDLTETSTLHKNSQCANFVPNYLQNPEFPYSESATEFATRLGIPSTGYSATQEILSDKNNISSGNTVCSTVTEESTLVLKCRLADSEETDFIEVELSQKCLNFEALVKTCLSEFDIDRTKLKKVRKLPNTIIRNDRDVKRLFQYQEIEIVTSE